MSYIINYCGTLNRDLFIQKFLQAVQNIKKDKDLLKFKNSIFESKHLLISYSTKSQLFDLNYIEKENILYAFIKKCFEIFTSDTNFTYFSIFLEIIELFTPYFKRDNKTLELIICNQNLNDNYKYKTLTIFQKFNWLKEVELINLLIINKKYNTHVNNIFELLIKEIFGIQNLKLFRDKNDKNILLYFFETITNPYCLEIFDLDWIERKRQYKFYIYLKIVNYLIYIGIPLYHVDKNGNTIFHYLFLCNENFLDWNVLIYSNLSNEIGKQEIKKLIIENLVVEKYKFYKNREGKYPLDYASSMDYFNVFNKAIHDKNSQLMEEIFRTIDNTKLINLFNDFLGFREGDKIISKIKNYINYINYRNSLIFNKIEKKVIPKVPKDVYFSIMAKMLYPEIPKQV